MNIDSSTTEAQQQTQANSSSANMAEEIKALRKALQELQSRSKETITAAKLPVLKPNAPPTFNGRENVHNWLFQVENFLKGHESVRNEQAVTYAASLFEKDAAMWWRLQSESKDSFETLSSDWGMFKTSLELAFQQINPTKRARDQLASLKQRTSVRAYVGEFRRILLEIGDMSESEKLDRFVRGLKQDVRKEVELREPTSFDEAARKADRYDSISFGLYRRDAGFTRVAPVRSTPEPMEICQIREARPKLTDELRQQLRRAGKCFFCRKQGHKINECPERAELPSKN
jgi:hypothetical protein